MNAVKTSRTPKPKKNSAMQGTIQWTSVRQVKEGLAGLIRQGERRTLTRVRRGESKEEQGAARRDVRCGNEKGKETKRNGQRNGDSARVAERQPRLGWDCCLTARLSSSEGLGVRFGCERELRRSALLESGRLVGTQARRTRYEDQADCADEEAEAERDVGEAVRGDGEVPLLEPDDGEGL